jgi:Tfp pilus assembly protein FimT
MVVLIVIGIVLAVAVPATTKFMRSNQLVGATNTLIADIHYTRSLATMRRKSYQITFGANGYTISQVAPLDTISTHALPSGVNCTASGTATFFAWGLSAPVAVTIRSGTDSTTVQVSTNGSVSHG